MNKEDKIDLLTIYKEAMNLITELSTQRHLDRVQKIRNCASRIIDANNMHRVTRKK